jgi:hypothetical protein
MGIRVLLAILALATPSATVNPAFTANILIVRSHDDIASWVVMNPAKRQGDVGRLRAVTRGMKIHLPVIATFADSQVGQKIALRAVLQIISPTGNTFLGTRCFANQVDPRAPRTIVLEPVLNMTFDSTDPLGEYRVRASIHRGNEVAVATETFRLK